MTRRRTPTARRPRPSPRPASGAIPLAAGSALLRVPDRSWPSLWLFPLGWAVYTVAPAVRRHAAPRLRLAGDRRSTSTTTSTPGTSGDFPQFFLNTLIVAVPAVILILLVASMLGVRGLALQLPVQPRAADACSRPATCCRRRSSSCRCTGCTSLLPLPGAAERQRRCCTTSTSAIILIHIVFQLGFCTFVLSNYMKTISKELTEAALVDGASRLDDLPAASSCRCAGRPWRPWRRSSSRSSTTTSSGR